MVKFRFLFLIFFLINFHEISYSSEIVSVEYNNKDIKLSLPNNYCDITTNIDGIFLKNFLEEQFSAANFQGPEPKVIFKLCNSNDIYPWGYIGFTPHENDIFKSQIVYNKFINKILGNTKIFEEFVSSVEKSAEEVLSEYGMVSELNLGTKAGLVWEDEDALVIKVVNQGIINNEKLTEITIGSITVLNEAIITYYITDTLEGNIPTSDKVLSLIKNAKLLKSFN